NRRWFKLIKNEHQRAQQQDGKLHRDFQNRVEHQSQSAFPQRSACEITLHLRLIRAEIRQRQEQSAQQTSPDRVTLISIQREVHCFQFPHRSRDAQHVVETQSIGHFENKNSERR